jgi:hypothetical protein
VVYDSILCAESKEIKVMSDESEEIEEMNDDVCPSKRKVSDLQYPKERETTRHVRQPNGRDESQEIKEMNIDIHASKRKLKHPKECELSCLTAKWTFQTVIFSWWF